MASHTRLHREPISFLRQHSALADQRHVVLLAWMVAGLLLSQTVCFDRWKTMLPVGHCLAASWQQRCRRWLSNVRIDVEAIYGPLILWALQERKKPGQALHLALDTTMLWNRCCVVVRSVVAHGRAIPLLWRTLEHPLPASAQRSRSPCWRRPISFWTDQRASGCWRIVRSPAMSCWLGSAANPAGAPSCACAATSRSMAPQRLWSARCAGCTCPAATAVASGTSGCGLMAARAPTCCSPIREACQWMSPGIWYLVSNAAPSLDLVWSYEPG